MPQEGKWFHGIVKGTWCYLSLETVSFPICEFEIDMTVSFLFTRLCLIFCVLNIWQQYLLVNRLFWKTSNVLLWQVYTYFLLSNECIQSQIFVHNLLENSVNQCFSVYLLIYILFVELLLASSQRDLASMAPLSFVIALKCVRIKAV